MAAPYHKVNTSLVIRVLDVQDTPPFFTGIPYRTTIQEGIPVVSRYYDFDKSRVYIAVLRGCG